MRPGERLALAVVLGLVVLVGGTAGATAYAWHSSGTVNVAVHEAGPDGTDVSLHMPGLLLNAAIVLCPTPRRLDEPNVVAAIAAMGAVADQLARMPDAVLVDVRDGDAIVRVEKKAGRLVIRVHDRRDRVDVDVPIGSVRLLAEKLGRASRRRAEA